MIFYTSDLHFGHTNCISFDNRPFENVEKMEEEMIKRWNGRVNDADTVYILGDVFYGYKKDKEELLKSLNGQKILIMGNHDGEIVRSEALKSCFLQIDKMSYVKDGGRKIVMCHFPIASWNGRNYGSLHFYGHIHSARGSVFSYMSNLENAYNVGCMINNYVPCTAEEVIQNNIAFKNSAAEK